MKRLALLALVCLAACGRAREQSVGVGFRVIMPVRGQDGELDDRPLAGADRLTTWVEHGDGQKVDDSERTQRLPAPRFSLPTVPFDDDLVLRVDAYGGDILLARGRSMPFEARRAGVTHAPDLYVGSLGRFGRRTSVTLPADPSFVWPTSDGALLALTSGAVVRFSPFAAQPLTTTTTTFDSTTRYAAVGTRFLAAFSPQAKTLTLLGADGVAARVLDGALLARHGEGAMLAADDAGSVLLVVGGLDDSAGESPTAVTRVDVPGDVAAASLTMLAPLPASRWNGALVWVPGATPAASRALVLGGESHTAVVSGYLLDPRDAGTVFAVTNVDVTNASAITLGAGQVMLVGGSGANDVRMVVVDDEPPSIALAAPSPPRLSVARDAPRLVRFAPALVLVLGGHAGGVLVRSAEIVDMRVFPGDTVQTGTMPSAVLAPGAAMLGDRAVWVFDRGGVFGYVAPRGQ